jgi:hypothetical protein
MGEPTKGRDLLSAIGSGTEHLGGSVLGAGRGLLGAIGLPGLGEKLEAWGQDPTRRKLVGGGTAAIGTLLTALAVRKLLSGGRRREPIYRHPFAGQPMFVEAAVSPYAIGFRVGMLKQGYPRRMGEPVKPLRGEDSKTATPRRWGVKKLTRQQVHDRVKRKHVSAESALGR